jgi:hypothetical protein
VDLQMFQNKNNTYCPCSALPDCITVYIPFSLINTGFLDFVHRPYRVGLPPSSPEDGNRSSFRNVVFSSYRILDDGQSPETQY